MRIKFLSFIGCCLFLTIIISSCLGSSDKYEYSSDATVRSFAIDTVKGVSYPFTIDQVSGEIYNADSLPYGTGLEKVVVTAFSHSGYYAMSADTLFYFPDSMDFREFSREDPLTFTIHSADLENTKDYKLWINVHQQEPDSIEWKLVHSSFSGGRIQGEQKTILFNHTFYTYYSHETVYVGNGTSWSAQALSGLPASLKVSSIIDHLDRLYAVTQEGEVYISDNAIDWRLSSLSGEMVYLITGFPDKLAGIRRNGNENYFVVTSDYSEWQNNEALVYEDFPLDKISSVYHTNAINQSKLFIMGENRNESDTISYTWFSEDGYQWGSNFITTKDKTCPKLENITMIWYDGKFYAFGGKGEEGFLNFYTSETGVQWTPVTSLALFPEEFNGREEFSFAVDKEGYIWIFWSNDSSGRDEVWKGQLNRLGFIKQ